MKHIGEGGITFCGCLNNDELRYSDITFMAYAKSVSGRSSTQTESSTCHEKVFRSFVYNIKAEVSKVMNTCFTY